MAGSDHKVPKPVGGANIASRDLSALVEDVTIPDEIINYEIRKRFRLPHEDWVGDFGSALRLAPQDAELQYVVWDGSNWNTLLCHNKLMYRGRAKTACRSIIMSIARLMEHAPDPSGATGNWKNDFTH